MSLDEFLRSQPGRCPDCGVHLKAQASLHIGGCLVTAKREGEQGMARAVTARPDDREAVDRAIQALASHREQFSANHVRELTGGIRGGVVGAAFQAAARSGLIRRVGYEPSTDPGTHSHPIATWTGTAA